MRLGRRCAPTLAGVRAARFSRYAGLWLVAGLLAVVLACCGLGERPTLADPTVLGGAPGTPTGVEAADAVLGPLEGQPPNPMTATYAVTTKFGGATTTATVVRSGPQQSVTIGDIRFLRGGGTDETCALTTGACEDDIQEARVSDTSLTSAFYGPSPAKAMRVSLSRSTGEPSASELVFAGQPAACIGVPVGQGTESTCATAGGVLALWDTAAVRVELQSLTDTADPAAFTATR
jgi:hypothetical protein